MMNKGLGIKSFTSQAPTSDTHCTFGIFDPCSSSTYSASNCSSILSIRIFPSPKRRSMDPVCRPSTSAFSRYMLLPTFTMRSPIFCVGWFAILISDGSGPDIEHFTGSFTMKSRTHDGSIICLLNATSESNGAIVSDFVMPKEMTNFLTASEVMPLRFSASIVGRRGSSYPETLPSSMSGFIRRFDTGIPSKASLEKTKTCGFLMESLSSMS